MKLAFITPTAYLDKFSRQGDFYLALAHLWDDKKYRQFHLRERRNGKVVYLDNGLFEGAQVVPERLIEITAELRPSVVCAPDVLGDSKGTIKAFKSFIKLKQEAGLVCKVMGIPQAEKDNPADWWNCFQFFDTTQNCDIIGLSILSIPYSFGQSITTSRVHIIEQLFSYSYLSDRRITPMHLLGLGDSYDDIRQATRLLPRDIISNDSSSTFVHGMHRVRYEDSGKIPGGKIKDKLDFNYKEIKIPQEWAIQYNMNKAKEIANGK